MSRSKILHIIIMAQRMDLEITRVKLLQLDVVTQNVKQFVKMNTVTIADLMNAPTRRKYLT